jgi:hypothetical protein
MQRILILIIVVFLSGCVALPIPNNRKLTPSFSGVVIDAESKLPISGVTVSISGWSSHSDPSHVHAESTTTDQAGYYEISAYEDSMWFFIWFGPAEGTCGGKVTYSHPNYKEAQYEKSIFAGAAVNGSCTTVKFQENMVLERK